MNPRDFRELASQLARAEKTSPAELRTAVSRAYYAAFNVATSLLKKLGVKIPVGWEGHRLLAVALRYCDDKELIAISHDLDELRGVRWAADYDMEDIKVEDQRIVRKWCARTKQMIKKLDECEADSKRFIEVRIKVRNWAGSADGAAKGFSLL
jgi:uncharacterized protein (UPF0332 family)